MSFMFSIFAYLLSNNSTNFTAGSTPQRATRPRARLKNVNTPPRADRQPRAADALPTTPETPAMEQAPLPPGAFLPDLDEPEFP